MSRAAIVLAVSLTALTLAGAATPATSGAFVGSASSRSTAATNPAWSCADAVVGEGPASLLSYAFDESAAEANAGTAIDATANHLNGTYSGERNKSAARGICYRDQNGSPYVLKGTGGYVQTPSITLSGAYSLEIWFSTSTSTTSTARALKTGFLVSSGSATSGSPAANAAAIYLNDAGRVVFAVGGGAASIATPAGTSYADGFWYDVVTTWSPSGGAALFVNGRLIGTARPASAPGAISGVWRIGTGSVTGWPLAPSAGSFSGSVRFATVYTATLSADAAAAHAAAGSVPRSGSDPWPAYRG